MGIFRTLFDSYDHRNCDVRLWDGSTWHGERAVPEFTIVLNHPGALEMMLSEPLEVSLGEAYAAGDYEIEGDLEGAFRIADHLAESAKTKTNLRLGFALPEFVSEASAEDVRFPGFRFQILLVFQESTLSCKLELICQRLQLVPGESFLDIGCGWGGLIMAKRYRVRSTGITLSDSQAGLAREIVREASH